VGGTRSCAESSMTIAVRFCIEHHCHGTATALLLHAQTSAACHSHLLVIRRRSSDGNKYTKEAAASLVRVTFPDGQLGTYTAWRNSSRPMTARELHAAPVVRLL